MAARSMLAWLGRHGSRVIALGVFLGLTIPPLASLMRPLLIPVIVGPFLIALVRLDWRLLRRQLDRPSETGMMVLWLMLLSPLLVHLALLPVGLAPAIHGGLVLMATAPPLMASGNLAFMLGLDAALAVVVTLLATSLMPLTLPLLALHLLGVEVDIPVGELMARLAAVVGGCFLGAWLLRRLLPAGFTERHAEPLDGLAVLGLVLFGIAIMDGVSEMILERPRFVLACALAIYGLNLVLQVVGGVAFAWRARHEALTLALCSGNRNLGLLLAALADRASTELFVLVAVAQLPIYTLPALQRPFYRRWLASQRGAEPLAGGCGSQADRSP